MNATITPDEVINMTFDPKSKVYTETKVKEPLLNGVQVSSLVSGSANLIFGGLWTWGAIACFAAGGPGLAILGGILAVFALLNAMGFIFSMIGFIGGFFL